MLFPHGPYEATNTITRRNGLWHAHSPLPPTCPLGDFSQHVPRFLLSAHFHMASPSLPTHPEFHIPLFFDFIMKQPILPLERITCSTHSFACSSTALVYNLKVPHSSRPGTDLSLGHKIYCCFIDRYTRLDLLSVN